MGTSQQIKKSVDINRRNTLIHSFRILNKADIIILAKKYDIELNTKNTYEHMQKILIDVILSNSKYNNLYEDIVENAFEPKLDVFDGFFVSYDNESMNFQFDDFIKGVKEFNTCKKYFNEIKFNNNVISFIVHENKDTYIYDVNSKISRVFSQEMQCKAEIYTEESIIYFQTSNSVIFKSLKTVLQSFFREYFNNDEIKLIKPMFSEKLDMVDNSDKLSKLLSKTSPITIKMLDIIFELENKKYGFTGFKASDIKFDHKESTEFTLSSRIDSVDIYGENLLFHDEIKQRIMDNRIIINISLIIEFNEQKSKEQVIKHYIEIGINYDKDYYRIFVKQDNKIKKSVALKAYNALKKLFITSYSDKKLKNKSKIIKLLEVK